MPAEKHQVSGPEVVYTVSKNNEVPAVVSEEELEWSKLVTEASVEASDDDLNVDQSISSRLWTRSNVPTRTNHAHAQARYTGRRRYGTRG
jgi:hypothetical protein